MKAVLPPVDAIDASEAARLAALAGLGVIDTPAERAFDTIVACAARTFGTKVALLSLVDDRRQWFKAKHGLEACETPREYAFCAHALALDELLMIPDATQDARFVDNPLVTGPPHIRFYAGVPLRVGTGGGALAVGTLCLIDDQPRVLAPAEAVALRDLAHVVEALLEARAATRSMAAVADDRQRMLQQLERSHRQARQAERMGNIGSWRLTLADSRAEWSDQVFVIHGMPVGEQPLLGAALEYYPSGSRERIRAALEHTAATGEPFVLESDFTTAQGEFRRVRVLGEVEQQDGVTVAVMGVFQDITNRYMMEQALRRSATVDDLTGLPNRAGFNAAVLEHIAAARAHGQPLALLLIDLDHFKAVNDRFGHRAGDALLVAVAARLQGPVLGGSFAARLGGDEFVVVVTAPALLADFDSLLQRLLGELCQPVVLGGDCVDASGTIGVGWLDISVRDPSDLLHRADTALYTAKRSERGSAAIFGQRARVVPTTRHRALV